MRLTILGGGGFRVPLVYRALCDDPDLGVDELVLYDVDASRLSAVSAVLRAAGNRGGTGAAAVRTTTDLGDAVRGADFVFSAIRVAGLAGRVCDERSALDEGVIGQETTGAGGVLLRAAHGPGGDSGRRGGRSRCADAWVINFTNPAGWSPRRCAPDWATGSSGICDSPVGLFRRVATGPRRDSMAEAEFDYAGLNHLGWLRAVRVDGRDRLPGAARRRGLARLGSRRAGSSGPTGCAPWAPSPTSTSGTGTSAATHLAAELAAGETRGEQLLREQEAFYGRAPHGAAVPDRPPGGSAYDVWERTRLQRESSYMADSRAQAEAGERDPYDLARWRLRPDRAGGDAVGQRETEPQTLVLNVANRGTFGFLDDGCGDRGAMPDRRCWAPSAAGERAGSGGAGSGHEPEGGRPSRRSRRPPLDHARSPSRRSRCIPLVGSVPVAARILDRQLAHAARACEGAHERLIGAPPPCLPAHPARKRNRGPVRCLVGASGCSVSGRIAAWRCASWPARHTPTC